MALGDFCVTCELNTFTERPKELAKLYTAFHRNIQDVFNEYGVQIMTPAYVADPPEPKMVPRDKWFEPPAVPRVESTDCKKEGEGLEGR